MFNASKSLDGQFVRNLVHGLTIFIPLLFPQSQLSLQTSLHDVLNKQVDVLTIYDANKPKAWVYDRYRNAIKEVRECRKHL